MEQANFVTKKSLKDTLRAMPVKGRIEIKNSDFKEMSVRIACIRLKKEGMQFSASSAGRIDSVEVIRLR